MLIASNLLLWIVVIVLATVVAALARQVGLLHERIAPAGALAISSGPQIGQQLPAIAMTTLSGKVIDLAVASGTAKHRLLFFLSPTCPVCKTLLPILKSACKREANWLDIVFASDGDNDLQADFAAEHGLDSYDYVVSEELGQQLRIGKLPYIVLADADNRVVAHGLVNSREHIESLFEAKERGVASIQDFLAQRGVGS